MIAPPPPAHFDVKVRAVQVIDWKQDYTATTCDGGIAELTGSGRSEVHLHTPALQPLVARRMPSGAVVLSVRGQGVLPIAGTLSREGTVASRQIKAGTGSCGSTSEPPPHRGQGLLARDRRHHQAGRLRPLRR